MDEETKKIVARWIAAQRYSLSVANDADKIMAKMFKELRTAIGADDYNMLVNQMVKDGSAELVSMFNEAFQAGVGAYVGAEAAQYGMRPLSVTKKMVNDALTAPLASQNITIKDTFDNMLRGVAVQSKAIIQRGIDDGLTIRQIRGELNDLQASSRRGAEAFSRSAVNAVANKAKSEMYSRNIDVADRYMWTSTLDGRTSDFCIAHDGKIFKVNDGPRPPAHINCRSYTVPVLVGETNAHATARMSPRPAVEPTGKFEKGDLKTRTGRIRKPAKGGQLKGTTTTARSYETWIKQQPAQYQRDVLGISAYNRLKGGEPLTAILRSRNSSLNFNGLKKALN